MALVDNTTYTGKDAQGFYAKALLEAKGLKEVLTPVVNVKSSIKLATWDLGTVVQSDDCTFSAQGEGTIAQKTFTGDDKKINMEYCIKTFEANYLSEQLRAGSNNTDFPEVDQWLVEQAMLKVGEELDIEAFGVGAKSIVTKALADANTIKPSLSGVFSSANALAHMSVMYLSAPASILDKEDLVFVVGSDVARFLRIAAIDTTQPEITINQGLDMVYMGVPIMVVPAMAANSVIIAQKKNLLMFTDLATDLEDIKVIPMYETTGEPKVRLVGRFKFLADYIISEEIEVATASA